MKLITPLLLILVVISLAGCRSADTELRSTSKGDVFYSILSSKKFPQGSYVGELKDGFPHGKGTFTYDNGDKYTGGWMSRPSTQWMDYSGMDISRTFEFFALTELTHNHSFSSFHGRGTLTYYDGDKYAGGFLLGAFHGNGTFTTAKDKYVGEYKNGYKNGFGTQTYSNGDKYVGEYKNGYKNGNGTYTYANGDKYVGEWKFNRKVGYGTQTYSNGDKYVGEFKDDKYHGKGNMTFPDGKIQSGIWANDKYLYDLVEHDKREKERLVKLRNSKMHAQKQRILSMLKPLMDDCQNIGFKADSKKYRECIVESI